MVRLYAAACVAGAAVPLFFLASFLLDEGVDPRAFADQATASDLSVMAWADVVVAGLVVIALALVERRRGLRRWWLALVATAAVGPSLGLPLLLLLRERSKPAAAPEAGGKAGV
jgi:Terpene cyclase DEP1